MTREEKLRTGTTEEIAEELCWLTQTILANAEDNGAHGTICEMCPASQDCRVGHTGFIDWLQEEAEEE